jgi:hypothetical protein
MIKLINILFEKTETLRNSSGKPVGTIMTQSNGRQVFRSKSGKLLGTYEPQSNYTRDYTGKVVGKGNILTYLIQAYV